VLRLKKRDADEEIHDEPPSDLISSADVFSHDGVEVGDLEDDEDDNGGHPRGLRLLASIPGPLIAVATFVPTFLAIFFGLSYVGASLQTGAPAPSATALMSDPATQAPRTADALRDPFVPPRVFEAPPARSGDPRDGTRPSESREPLRAPSVADLPTPAIESTGPTLPPAQPRATIAPVPESRVGRAAEPPRQPQAAVLNTTPQRSSGRDWTPAAAFADREAANRLVSSIQQQGYPVEIRQESSSSRPWVVWIAGQPRAGERRR